MPRLLLEYTQNIHNHFNPSELLKMLATQAGGVPSVNPALIKARIWSPHEAWIDPRTSPDGRGYIFVLFEWLEGRDSHGKNQMKKALQEPLKVIKRQIEQQGFHVSVTLEIREIAKGDHFAF